MKKSKTNDCLLPFVMYRCSIIFVIAPAGIIFTGNLIYIAVEIFKELRGRKRR